MANILVVDDIAMVRKKLSSMLSQAGHNVIAEADDGEQAFREYERHKPDLVMMDITMPNLDGIGAVRKITACFPNAKIIMVSALAQKHMVLQALQCGARNYILKPVEFGRLVDVIKKTLEDDSIREDKHSGSQLPDFSAKTPPLSAQAGGAPFTVENDKGVFIVKITDKLNMTNVNALMQAIQGFLVIRPINIVFNFGGLNHVDDQILHVIIDAYIQVRNLGGAVKLDAMGEALTRVIVEKYGHIIAFS